MPQFPSELPFVAFLRYSSHGITPDSRRTKEWTYAIKDDRALTGLNAIDYTAKRILETIQQFPCLQSCLGANVTLVPMPRSSPLVTGALWPALRISQSLVANGLAAQVLTCLERHTPIRKSATAPPGTRPTPQEHHDTTRIQLGLQFQDVKAITLIDDVITKGATYVGVYPHLRAAFPDVPIIPTDRRESLTAWCELYLRIEGGAEGSNTWKAKKRDLEAFLTYFLRVAGRDRPDQWTRSLTEGFLKHLLRDERKSPSTVNRVLATLKHTARWIESQRPFLAGNPTERVQDLTLDEPEWKGLRDIDLTRLRSAAEQLVRLNTRKGQQPLRDYALLTVLLQTGLRVSEVLALNLDQYRDKHFTNVNRKGRKVSRRVLLPKTARETLDRYLDEVRGRKPGPLFCSKTGARLARQNAHDALQAMANQANSIHVAPSSSVLFRYEQGEPLSKGMLAFALRDFVAEVQDRYDYILQAGLLRSAVTGSFEPVVLDLGPATHMHQRCVGENFERPPRTKKSLGNWSYAGKPVGKLTAESSSQL